MRLTIIKRWIDLFPNCGRVEADTKSMPLAPGGILLFLNKYYGRVEADTKGMLAGWAETRSGGKDSAAFWYYLWLEYFLFINYFLFSSSCWDSGMRRLAFLSWFSQPTSSIFSVVYLPILNQLYFARGWSQNMFQKQPFHVWAPQQTQGAECG